MPSGYHNVTPYLSVAGAKLVEPMEDKFYGDRSGCIEDPFGHRWHLSTHTRDVSPAEIRKAAAAFAKGQAPGQQAVS